MIPVTHKEDLAREPVPGYILEVAAKFPMVGPSRKHDQGRFFDKEAFLVELESARPT